MQPTGIGLLTPVGQTTVRGISYDVFAELQADYDAATAHLTITRDCFLRPQFSGRLSQRSGAAWLPVRSVDREIVSDGRSVDLARAQFRGWCHRVRQAVAHSRS